MSTPLHGVDMDDVSFTDSEIHFHCVLAKIRFQVTFMNIEYDWIRGRAVWGDGTCVWGFINFPSEF